MRQITYSSDNLARLSRLMAIGLSLPLTMTEAMSYFWYGWVAGGLIQLTFSDTADRQPRWGREKEERDNTAVTFQKYLSISL